MDHESGEVHFDEVTGDIRATVIQDLITLHLPQTAQYAIDAKSRIGAVISDFGGTTTRKRLGHAFVGNPQSPHRLDLRIGYGDIVILRIQTPPTP